MQPISTSLDIPQEKLDAAYRRLFESKLIGVCFTDFSGNITGADQAFLETLGYDSRELVDGQKDLRQITLQDHYRSDEEAFEKLSAFGSCAGFEKQFIHKSGHRVPVLVGAVVQNDEIVWFVLDLSQNEESRGRLDHLAYHDALTDLPNQTLFKDRLKQAIALSSRSDQLHAVVLINLDRFKTINDSLGYVAGDQVLKAVAQRLTSCVRESDTVGRIGADEFAILLMQISRAHDAANTARAIKQAIEQTFLIDDRELSLSTSIGISLYPHDGRDTPTLLKSAGIALERAKESGGSTYEFYTAGRTSHALKQLMLETTMRPGLERGEFFVEYQPQVDAKTFQLVGMEALVRWNHPSLGLLNPSEFIPLAEDSGIIKSIGEWVMRTASAQAKGWINAGFAPMCLSVNVSARQFQQAAFVATVHELLKENGLDPRLLEIELTEGSIMKDPSKAIEKLHELRKMGIKIAIDDFGTGYCSLSYLKRFPIDTLKIDQSFVADVCVDNDDAAIVRTIVTLGHALGVNVIAEGVETAEQLEYLMSVGCDVLQGFLFSRPLSSEAFGELLMEQLRVTTPSNSFPTTRLSLS
jgi:diguanylate cyclase (GGDEF)-like protein/PAS domain S-box-containing protein